MISTYRINVISYVIKSCDEIGWSFNLYMDLTLATLVLNWQPLTKAQNNPEQCMQIVCTHIWKPWSCAKFWHVLTESGNRVWLQCAQKLAMYCFCYSRLPCWLENNWFIHIVKLFSYWNVFWDFFLYSNLFCVRCC